MPDRKLKPGQQAQVLQHPLTAKVPNISPSTRIFTPPTDKTPVHRETENKQNKSMNLDAKTK